MACEGTHDHVPNCVVFIYHPFPWYARDLPPTRSCALSPRHRLGSSLQRNHAALKRKHIAAIAMRGKQPLSPLHVRTSTHESGVLTRMDACACKCTHTCVYERACMHVLEGATARPHCNCALACLARGCGWARK
eukprot:6173717-Pleurochrysis_carterae.AAC.1